MTRWIDPGDVSKYELKRIESSPSFMPAWAQNDEKGLMEVTISEPVRNCLNGEYIGREYIDYYPRDFLMPGENICGPVVALNAAYKFYNEGLECLDEKEKDIRIGCFRSAELLMLHAALYGEWEGQSFAWLTLGYLYEYDRTEGNLWPMWMDEIPTSYHPVLQMTDHNDRAYACYKLSMEGGNIEGMYKFADCLRWGKGCDIDLNRAFELYSQVREQCQHSAPHILGSCAYRLASCYEDGEGCARDIKKAKEFYERAIVWFEIEMNDSTLYAKNLERCKKGLARVTQELEI